MQSIRVPDAMYSLRMRNMPQKPPSTDKPPMQHYSMKLNNFDDLRLLIAVGETGSFTDAGLRCGISTAAVSTAIKRVEGALGARLFVRSTRSVQTTPEGEIMIDHARRALDLLALGQMQLSQAGTTHQGKIRITAPTLLAQSFLSDWIGKFSNENPGLSIELLVTDRHMDLVRNAVDLGIRHGPLPDSSLVAKLLRPVRRIACASPEFVQRRPTFTHPQQLANHECLTCMVRGRMQDVWEFSDTRKAEDTETIRVTVRGRLTSSDASTSVQWAIRGYGVVYIPQIAADFYIRSGQLVRVLPDFVGESAPLFTVFPGGRFIPPRVSYFIEQLDQNLLTPGSTACV